MMQFRWIGRGDPMTGLFRLGALLWGRSRGNPGHTSRLSLALRRPFAWSVQREHDGWFLTAGFVRLHYRHNPQACLV